MTDFDGLPAAFEQTRVVLHRVAAHVLARRRHEVTGRLGLRACPGGFGTPAFGDAPETIRVAGGFVVRERHGDCAYLPIGGSTLRALAAFAGTDITTEFAAGADTPPAGDVDEPITVDSSSLRILAEWFAFGWRVLDEVLAAVPATAEPAVIQLWPEHFDAGTSVEAGPGGRVNLGASPGDAYSAEPYLYVGPWGPERPGDPEFWNAPFGAVLALSTLYKEVDPVAAGVEFLREGLRRMMEGSGS